MGLIQDSAEHKAIRETVAGIASRYGAQYFTERGRSGGGIDELWKDLGAGGLLGLHLPEEYGGGGGGMTEAVVVVEELAAHGMPLLVWVISPAICGSILARHASEDMKQQWLPVIADGTKIMAFGLTEPDAGSNSHNVKTTARRTQTGWAISGSKYYISAVDQSDAILVVTRDAEQSPDKQFTVYFDNVQVGHDALIGAAGKGLRQVFDGLNPERILVGALCGGIGRYAVGKAAAYAKERQVWSTPIGAHQGIAHPIAEAHIAVELSRMATVRSAELFDAGENAGEAANIAKFAASEAALKALDQAIQTHGGNGLSHEYGLSELWFVTRLMRTAPVSREMVLNYIAQSSLGLPRSY